MTRYQPRSLEPLPDTEHTLRGVVDEIRDAQRPPGVHVNFPEVEWPEASDQPQDMEPSRRPIDRRAAWDDLPIGMIEPEEEPASGLAPVVFWAIIALAFGCVLAKAGGVAVSAGDAIEMALVGFVMLFGVFVVCMAVSDLRDWRARKASEGRRDAAAIAAAVAAEREACAQVLDAMAAESEADGEYSGYADYYRRKAAEIRARGAA